VPTRTWARTCGPTSLASTARMQRPSASLPGQCEHVPEAAWVIDCLREHYECTRNSRDCVHLRSARGDGTAYEGGPVQGSPRYRRGRAGRKWCSSRECDPRQIKPVANAIRHASAARRPTTSASCCDGRCVRRLREENQSNIVPWQMLCGQYGCDVQVVGITD